MLGRLEILLPAAMTVRDYTVSRGRKIAANIAGLGCLTLQLGR